MDTKFLTVMAVLDEDAQKTFAAWQRAALDAGLTGTQTMGIPFHISLGSYPTDREEELIALIRDTAAKYGPFPVAFDALGDFGGRVLFARPDIPAPLAALRGVFDSDYPKQFPWSPHATLFCGEEGEVSAARDRIAPQFRPLHAVVTALEMGAFFPPRFICRQALTGENG